MHPFLPVTSRQSRPLALSIEHAFIEQSLPPGHPIQPSKEWALPKKCSYLLLGGVISFLVLSFYSILTPASYNYVEGDTTTWIHVVKHGLKYLLYQPPSGLPMLKSNYSPIYLHLIAYLASTDESIPLVGRIISFIGYLWGLLMIGVSVRSATSDWRFGAIAMALCCLAFRTSVSAMICYPDALAFGLGATAVTLAALRSRGWPILSSICFTLSIFTKHSMIIFPCGVFVWALFNETRVGLLSASITALLIGFGLWRLHLFGPLVIDSIAPFTRVDLIDHFKTLVAVSIPAIAMAWWTWRSRLLLSATAQRVLGPWFYVFLCGLPWLLALGREGSSANYMAELIAAVAVILTVARSHGFLVRLFAVQVVLLLGEMLLATGHVIWIDLPKKMAELRAARTELSALREPRIIAEPTWFAISSGVAPVVIPFLGLELVRYGRWDPSPLIEEIRQKRITRALLSFSLEDEGWRGCLPAGVFDALRESYALESKTESLHIYRPRSADRDQPQQLIRESEHEGVAGTK